MIEISGLTKKYGTHTVLDDIDFQVGQGQIAAVVGRSGAGKSTLARCINLLEQPTSGSVRVAGQELTHLSRKELRVARRAIGTVFQSASLLRRQTAAQNVALPLQYLELSEQEKQRRVRDLLDRVGLLHRANHYPAQLSGGQRQRVGIARGLALKPQVLLADEATSGLDPDATASILRLLTELRDDLGVTVLVITHEMDVVRTVADVVAHLDNGRRGVWQIIRSVQLTEALPGIVGGLTLNIIAMIEYSAIAGAIGAGGLGYLAVNYGYEQFDDNIMISCILLLIALVQVVQFTGDRIVRSLLH